VRLDSPPGHARSRSANVWRSAACIPVCDWCTPASPAVQAPHATTPRPRRSRGRRA
jgi:hypothetical protein